MPLRHLSVHQSVQGLEVLAQHNAWQGPVEFGQHALAVIKSCFSLEFLALRGLTWHLVNFNTIVDFARSYPNCEMQITRDAKHEWNAPSSRHKFTGKHVPFPLTLALSFNTTRS